MQNDKQEFDERMYDMWTKRYILKPTKDEYFKTKHPIATSSILVPMIIYYLIITFAGVDRYNWWIMVGVGGCLILGVGLAIANKYFEVEEDDRFEKIEFILPSYNCGACGYVGCDDMARAILNGEVTEVKACKVISEANAEALKEYCKTIKNNKGETIELK